MSQASSYQCHLTPQTADHAFSLIGDYNVQNSVGNDDDELVIDNVQPCLENALAFNQAYQAILEETLQEMGVLLDVNRERQRDLQDTIDRITKPVRIPGVDGRRSKRTHFSIFGAPYFKDTAYQFPPDNDDTKLAKEIGFYNVALKCAQKPCKFQSFEPFFRSTVLSIVCHAVNKYEGSKLLTAVRAEARRIKAVQLSQIRELLKIKLSEPSHTAEELKSIRKEINSVGRQMFECDLLKDEELFTSDDLPFDWEKISVQEVYLRLGIKIVGFLISIFN